MRILVILAALPLLGQPIPPIPPAVTTSSVPQVAGLNIIPIAQPTAPTVTPTCTGTCATTYSYVVEAYTGGGISHTQASSAGTTTLQASTLDTSHFNQVATATLANSSYCKVFRTVGGGSQGIIGTVTCGGVVKDSGLTGDASSADTTNTTGTLSVGGSTGAMFGTEGADQSSRCVAGVDGIWFDATHAIKACANGVATNNLGQPPPVATASVAGIVIPRYGLIIDGSGNVDTTSQDRRKGGYGSAVIVLSGCPLGFTARGTGTVTGVDPTAWTDVGGRLKLPSTASASTYAGCEFAGSNPYGGLNQNANWSRTIRFALGQTTNTRNYFGFNIYSGGMPTWTNTTTCTACGAAMWLMADTNSTAASASNSHFFFQTCYASSCASSDTGVAFDTLDHSLVISSISAGSIIFSLYDAAGTTLQAGPTTLSINTGGFGTFTSVLRCGNDTTASASFCYITMDQFDIWGLAR